PPPAPPADPGASPRGLTRPRRPPVCYNWVRNRKRGGVERVCGRDSHRAITSERRASTRRCDTMDQAAGVGEGESDEAVARPDPGEAGLGGGHVRREQEGLWREVLSLSDYVKEALRTAVEALFESRPDLVAEVRAEESEIDRWEVRIER